MNIPQHLRDMLITDGQFDHLMEMAKIFVDQIGEPTPHLVIGARKRPDYEKDYGITVVALMCDEVWNSFEGRMKIMEATGCKLHEDGQIPMGVILVSAAWMSSNKDLQPSEDPNRREVVILSGLTLDGRTRMSSAPIVHENGQTLIGDWNNPTYDKWKFPLVQEVYRGWFNSCSEHMAKKTTTLVDADGKPLDGSDPDPPKKIITDV